MEFRRPDRAYIEGLKCDALIRMLLQHGQYAHQPPSKRAELGRIAKTRDAQSLMHKTIEDATRKSNAIQNSAPIRYHPDYDAISPEPRFSILDTRGKRDELHLPNTDDPLIRRFSALRSSDTKPPYPATDPKPIGLPASPRPAPNGTTHSSRYNSTSSKPTGPRDMPSVPIGFLTGPFKVPVNGRISTNFPRAPDPVYSPSKSIDSLTNITPPRSNVRTVESQGNREPASYGMHTNIGYSRPPSREIARSRPELPQSVSISPKELHDRLRNHNVLVVDIRSREAFDEGHIFCKNIICVEPIRLTYGMSFEDLRDTLLYSPDIETHLFETILDFDLVVYYDQNSSDRFLDGSPKTASSPWLRAFYETLETFNDRAPLRRPPVVLSGGLYAWVDLMGPQSLQSSKTMQIPQSLHTKKPPRRLPHKPSITGGTSSREIRLRRLQQYDPLNETEKRNWQEQLRKEEVKPTDLRAYQTGDIVDENVEESESPTFHRTVDDFLRRYPAAPPVPTSMIVPTQESRQSRSMSPIISTVPSRPAPAVSRISYGGVSDRIVSGNIPGSQKDVAAQQPLYRPRLITATYKLPRTGLKNYGVTCYMNSTIQCLSATIDLAIFFLQDTWKGQVQNNWKGSHGFLPDIFSNLIRSLWNHESTVIRPKSLRTFCGRMNVQWSLERQQDAEEFLVFLLDCLHEDLNTNWKRTPLLALSEEQELAREKLSINLVSRIEFDRFTHREASYISDMFAGQHASRLTCLTCRKTSTSYEAFYSLSLEIPQTGISRITDCLANYTKVEQLEVGEEWKCPHCKVPRAATKRLLITRSPRILAISFKRFSGSSSGRTRKIHTPIDFPLFGLDMRPCMAETQYPREVNEDFSRDPATTPPFLYDAYAVTRHVGNVLEGGHYIAMVRDAARMTWRRFDDDKVTDFDPSKLRFEDRLQNGEAYIVFYERSRAR